jgi:hypothetical protein
MKRMSDVAIRQALIAAGAVDSHGKPESVVRHKMNTKISRVNAILARRSNFSNTQNGFAKVL